MKPKAHRARAVCWVAVCSAVTGLAQAQQAEPPQPPQPPQPLQSLQQPPRALCSASVSAQITWTNNADLAASGLETEDTTIEVAPSLGCRLQGQRLRASGELGAAALHYVNGVGRDQVQPRVQLQGNLEAIERLFFVDARVLSTQLAQDPFVGRADGSTSNNVMTVMTYAVSPYLDWHVSARTRLLLRQEQTRTQTHGATTDVRDGRFSLGQARFEVAAQPVGLDLTAQRNQSWFSGQSQDTLLQSISRAALLWAPAQEWVLNARVGREKTDVGGVQLADDSLYGGGFQWRPGPRTLLKGTQEHRFFGTSWDAALTHRMPWLAWDLRATRELLSFPQELLSLPSGGHVALLLDAMLTTRFPDPIERARQVQDLIRQQGLPATLGAPLTIYTPDAFISTERSLSLGLMGRHSTVTCTGGTQRVQIVQPGTGAAAFSSTGLGSSDQFVWALNVSHRWGRVYALNVTVSRAQIEALGSGTLDQTVQRSMRVALTQRLSPNTELVWGARRRFSESRIAVDFTESAVFAALSTRV